MKGVPGHDAGPSNRGQAMQIQTDADVNQTYIREMHSQDQVRILSLCIASMATFLLSLCHWHQCHYVHGEGTTKHAEVSCNV